MGMPSYLLHDHTRHSVPPPPPAILPTSNGARCQQKKRKGPWLEEEDELLGIAINKVAVVEHDLDGQLKKPRIDWSLVSAHMGSTRSSKQCYGRYCNSGMDTDVARRVGVWTLEEDSILLEELQRQRDECKDRPRTRISWSSVSELLGGARTRKQCMVRYNSVLRFQDSAEKVTGNWDVSEDSKLVEAVRLYRGKGRKGGVAWRLVSEHMGRTRTMKQCKKRWDDAFEHPSSL
jgi:hypothetical protein